MVADRAKVVVERVNVS